MPRFGDDLVAAIESAERWAIHDPDPVSRSKLDTLIDAGDPALIRLFSGRLAFGTAGLRAEVGVGPTKMNALVVRQTTAGVVDWLRRSGIAKPRVVIGFDARHDSHAWARHGAAAVHAGGGHPLCATEAAPTPVFAHALLTERADAAIVVTASHNPPADNGYKLYLGDGLQLTAPADVEIAERIEALAQSWSSFGTQIDDAYAEFEFGDPDLTASWIAYHHQSAMSALMTDRRTVSLAYTAMHGVAGPSIMHTFQSAGFVQPIVVAEQFEPDGDFPTVPFPNPEETGAMDLVMATARKHRADVAVANDPDGDRVAVAVPSRNGDGFTALSGNELGALLGDHVLRHTTGSDRLVARSVVSSRQLDALAAAAGVHCEVTLTGFKWIARPIVTHAPLRFVFGFEEAIGYCIGERVRDKDGVTAALVAAEMFAGFRAANSSAWQRLDELAAAHGVYANRPIVIRFDDDPSRGAKLMAKLEGPLPDALGGQRIVESGPVGLGSLPPTPGLHMVTADDTRVIVRPSGTEPKFKAYIEVIQPVQDHALVHVEAARERAASRLEAVTADVQALLNPGRG